MIRPFTLVTLLLACASGAWMFVVKHRADAIEQQLGTVSGQIRAAERQIRVLKAEWALQTDPNRLAWLAQIFLPDLQPMAPDQLVNWKQLAARLPPPGSAPPALPLPPPLPPGLAAPDSAASAPTAPAAPTAGAPVAARPDRHAPVQTAAATTPRAARHKAIATQHAAIAHHVTHRMTHDLAAARPVHHVPPTHRAAPHLAYHAPIGASVLAVRAEPLPPPRPRPGAQSQPAQSQPAQSQPAQSQLARSQPARPWQAPAHRAPMREASADATPVRHPARSSSSVFGGLGANLPPPRPIGNTPQ